MSLAARGYEEGRPHLCRPQASPIWTLVTLLCEAIEELAGFFRPPVVMKCIEMMGMTQPAVESRAKKKIPLFLPVLCELNPFDYSICTLNQLHSWLGLEHEYPCYSALRSQLVLANL